MLTACSEEDDSYGHQIGMVKGLTGTQTSLHIIMYCPVQVYTTLASYMGLKCDYPSMHVGVV